MPGVELCAVIDNDVLRAEQVATQYSARALYDARDVLDEVEAVTIAVPTEAHARVAMPLLEAGISALVEKPIASSVADADRMIAVAERSGAILGVGHSERFNPAVLAAMPLLTRPRFIEVHRLGVFPQRSLDVDVVLDVMIHDLDLVLSMVPSDVVSVEAVGVPVLTGRVDIANARVRFANGCIANLTASRISRDRIRKIRVFQAAGYLSLDCAAPSVQCWQLQRSNNSAPAVQQIEVPVAVNEPLRLELTDFVAAVRDRRSPAVTGRDGRRALALAAQIVALAADESTAAVAGMR